MPFDGTYYEKVSPVTQMLLEGKQQVQRGWCQQVMRRRGSACMIGSLTICDFDVFVEAEKLLLEAIGGFGHSYRSVAEFNDDVTRTKEQVLEVYDRAIELSKPIITRSRLYREPVAA